MIDFNTFLKERNENELLDGIQIVKNPKSGRWSVEVPLIGSAFLANTKNEALLWVRSMNVPENTFPTTGDRKKDLLKKYFLDDNE